MIKKSECVLVSIEETVNEKKSPIKKEYFHKVICDDMGVWSSNYYVTRDRDMMNSVNLRVAKGKGLQGQLRYVDYKGKRYSIKNVLNDNDKGMRFMILDCEEYKR